MNPDLIQGYSRAGHPIVNFIDLVEPVNGESGSVIRCVSDDEPVVGDELAARRGRRPEPPK